MYLSTVTKPLLPIIIVAAFLTACKGEQEQSQQNLPTDSLSSITTTPQPPAQTAADSTEAQGSTEAQESTETQESLNDIRFKDWDGSKWLDNEYIRTLRKYLDDYSNGQGDNPELAPYRELLKGQFVVFEIQPAIAGGASIRIIFPDNPQHVFSSWVYSQVDTEKKTVTSYECRSVRKEEEPSELTKEEILQLVEEHPELKLW